MGNCHTGTAPAFTRLAKSPQPKDVYDRILQLLGIETHVRALATKMDERYQAFLAPDYPPDEEYRETERIFTSFYDAVMSQRNGNWMRHRAEVFAVLPPSPRKYLNLTRGLSARQIKGLCERRGLGRARWATRYLQVRHISRRVLSIHDNHGGVRRYYRDIFAKEGLSKLVMNVVQDKDLPGIGAKTSLNSLRDVFGLDLVKPDVVLQRVFQNFGWIEEGEDNPETFLELCSQIKTHRPCVVDHVFWVFGNASGMPRWGIDRQYCGGTVKGGFMDCGLESCFCKGVVTGTS
jgi:hypothetical protein